MLQSAVIDPFSVDVIQISLVLDVLTMFPVAVIDPFSVDVVQISSPSFDLSGYIAAEIEDPLINGVDDSVGEVSSLLRYCDHFMIS